MIYFLDEEESNCFVSNVFLTNTISKVGDRAFIDANNIVLAAGACDNVELDKGAWSDETVVTPNTCK